MLSNRHFFLYYVYYYYTNTYLVSYNVLVKHSGLQVRGIRHTNPIKQHLTWGQEGDFAGRIFSVPFRFDYFVFEILSFSKFIKLFMIQLFS